jgi:hypothetical protein
MSEMVSNVVNAIGPLLKQALEPGGKPVTLETLARAAIEAMREPTEEMRSAVENDQQIQCGLDDCNKHDIPYDAWRLMIEAALK